MKHYDERCQQGIVLEQSCFHFSPTDEVSMAKAIVTVCMCVYVCVCMYQTHSMICYPNISVTIVYQLGKLVTDQLLVKKVTDQIKYYNFDIWQNYFYKAVINMYYTV